MPYLPRHFISYTNAVKPVQQIVHCGPSARRKVVPDRYVGVCRSKVEIGRSRGGIKQATRVIEVSKAEEANEKENEERMG